MSDRTTSERAMMRPISVSSAVAWRSSTSRRKGSRHESSPKSSSPVASTAASSSHRPSSDTNAEGESGLAPNRLSAVTHAGRGSGCQDERMGTSLDDAIRAD
jgi:hypothetical protein